MLKAQASPIPKPLHLLQPNIPGKQIFIFITDSIQSFWMKEDQGDWEAVLINPDDYSCDRDGGSATFKFNGKEFNQLYISSPLGKETSHISGDRQRINLEKLLLSKQKLEEIDITNLVKLDLSNIPETIADAEKGQNKKLHKRNESSARRLSNLFTKDPYLFFDALSENSQVFSKSGTSSRMNN